MIMSYPVFTYGTLMFPEVVEALTGEQLIPVPATLTGFARYAIKNACYPGIVNDINASVDGVVYREVSNNTLQVFDWFEAEIYERLPVKVDIQEQKLEAFAYVVSEKFRRNLDSVPWQPEIFLEQHSTRYIEKCRQYQAIWKQELL